MSAFDWRGMLGMALARGPLPGAFWAMTPAEFLVWSGRAEGAAGTLTRAGFDALVAAFPDEERNR